MKLRRNQIISPKNFAIFSLGNQKYLPSYLENSSRGTEASSFLEYVSPAVRWWTLGHSIKEQ